MSDGRMFGIEELIDSPEPSLTDDEIEDEPHGPLFEPQGVEVTAFVCVTSATGALTLRAHAMSALTAANPKIWLGPEQRHWWVEADGPLHLLRELADFGDGKLYIQRSGSLHLDPGFGPTRWAESPPADVNLNAFTGQTFIELLERAGGHALAPPSGLESASIFVPGHLARPLIVRALDLGLSPRSRIVELRPLGAASAQIRHGCIELRLSGVAGIPPSFLAAAARKPNVIAARHAADSLMVDVEFAPPVSDSHLAAEVPPAESWLLSTPGRGHWRLSADGDYESCAGLVDVSDIPVASNFGAAVQSPVDRIPLQVVRSTTRGQKADAWLVDNADLPLLAATTRGRPIADVAWLTAGENYSLVTAPGGILSDAAVGIALYCLGPGQLYLPLGFRLRPRVPPSARRSIFNTDASIAEVVLDSARAHFDLTAGAPLWTLWLGDRPPIAELAAEHLHAGLCAIAERHHLDAIEEEAVSAPTRPTDAEAEVDDETERGRRRSWRERIGERFRRPAQTEQPVDWTQEAVRAERAGDLVAAADLFSRHNEPLRAARLYERAALLIDEDEGGDR